MHPTPASSLRILRCGLLPKALVLPEQPIAANARPLRVASRDRTVRTGIRWRLRVAIAGPRPNHYVCEYPLHGQAVLVRSQNEATPSQPLNPTTGPIGPRGVLTGELEFPTSAVADTISDPLEFGRLESAEALQEIAAPSRGSAKSAVP